MSDSGLQFLGRPKTEQEYDSITLFRYCGGSGAGVCIDVLGTTYVRWAFKVPKFVVYNRKIIFENTGVRIYSDAGPAGLCDHSLGAEQSFWVGLTSDASANPELVARAGVELSGALTYQIEFSANSLPQPKDASWNGIIYMCVAWLDPNFVNEGGSLISTLPLMKIVKHDYDIKI